MIYLDNSATTQPCPACVRAMPEALTDCWGNPSSVYALGIDAAHRLRQARQAVAEIGAVASGISGSGPTLFALCDKPDTAQRVADWLGKNYLQNQEGFVHICRLDTAGARVLEN